MPALLRPILSPAPRVLLPGDPGRALALAQVLLGDDRRMSHHHRGLWGYTGTAHDGAALTIQSTGIGGASAAIVLAELAALGARTAIRIGTATGLAAGVACGDLVAAHVVLAHDGASRAAGAAVRTALEPELAGRLAAGAAHAGVVASADLPAELGCAPVERVRETVRRLVAEGALVVDLETAALTAVAAAHEVRFGALLAVASTGAVALDDPGLEAAGVRLGEVAAAALAA